MKKLLKYINIALFGAATLLFSCEAFEKDITEDPNALSPSSADVDLYLNAIQVDFGRFVHGMGNTTGELSRLNYMFGRNYQNNYSPVTFNRNWRRAYQEMLQDIRLMTPVAAEAGLNRHIGMAQVMEAYTITTLVDVFGDVPYGEALLGSENLNPAVEGGASIYAKAITLLDQAIANFEGEALAPPAVDLFYGRDWAKWVRAANSLKMKLYLQTRLVDASAITNFNNIVNSGNYIASNDDNFEFPWGNTDANPDTRHPYYADNYTPTGAVDYISNWLMNEMLVNDDPRIRYYFYRQVDEVPESEQLIRCSIEPAPAHYVSGNEIYCSLPDGYWGRDHGDNSGTPPDGQLRTMHGVYPAGGKFDDDTFAPAGRGAGAGGSGITPIMQAAWVDFMRAEVAMAQNNTAQARTLMLDGIQKSVDRVVAFGAKDNTSDVADFEPSAEDITAFVNSIGAAFDAAPNNNERFNILAGQYFVSLFGNGLDSYNFYRRTGFPDNTQPNIEPSPGAFIRSFFYPADFVNRNSSTDQKSDVTEKVFWDNNPDNWPPAN